MRYESGFFQEQYWTMTDDDLKGEFKYFSERGFSKDLLPGLYALCAEAYTRVLGEYVFCVHADAAAALIDGKIAEAPYADDKNATVTTAALIFAALGKKVWILSSAASECAANAARYGELAAFFGLSACAATGEDDEKKRAASYRSDIIYTDPATFGSDYAHFLADPAAFSGMKDLDAAIVDGAGSVMVENADMLCRYQENGRLSEKYLCAILKDFRSLCGITASAAGLDGLYKELYGLEVERIPQMKPDVNRRLPDKVFLTGAERSAKIAAYVKKRLDAAPEGGSAPALIINTFDKGSADRIARLLRQEGIEPAFYSPYMPYPSQRQAVRNLAVPGRVTVALELGKNRILPSPGELLSEPEPSADVELISVGHAPTRYGDQMLLGQVAYSCRSSCFYCACDDYPSGALLEAFRSAFRNSAGETPDPKLKRQWDAVCEKEQMRREAEVKENALQAGRGIKKRTPEKPKALYGWDAPASGLVARSDIPAYTGSEPFLFVSYSHSDSEAVGRLIEGLQEKGYRVWWDLSIPFGAEWEKELFTRIQDCSTLLAFVSEDYLARKYTTIELDYATESLDPSKPCLLALIEDVDLPDRYKTRFGKSQFAESRRFSGIQQFIDYLASSPQLEQCRD